MVSYAAQLLATTPNPTVTRTGADDLADCDYTGASPSTQHLTCVILASTDSARVLQLFLPVRSVLASHLRRKVPRSLCIKRLVVAVFVIELVQASLLQAPCATACTSRRHCTISASRDQTASSSP